MGTRKQDYRKAIQILCLNKYKYELGCSNKNGKGTILRNGEKKMSSLDNLVDVEVWQLRIKDHRNSEL